MIAGSIEYGLEPTTVGLAESGGWKRYEFPDFKIWFCGHLYDFADPRKILTNWPAAQGDAAIKDFVDRLDGHFALIYESASGTVAAVDPVRSLPIFFAEHRQRILISPNSEALRVAADLSDINAEGALSLAMSGYTVGTRTLFHCLEQLAPGELLFAVAGEKPRRVRYHRYSPWNVESESPEEFERRLGDITIALFERILRQSGGRQIAVPLSAGLDSRLVVSALAEVGARNVVCFTYGLAGNYEAQAARTIARQLGYEWHFVPFTPASQRKFWTSELNTRYQDFADSNCSTTVVHDLPAIQYLLDREIIDKKSIIINGNSGDYITGLHIQPPVSQGLLDGPERQRTSIIADTIVKKHFRLWSGLATAANDAVIKSALLGEIDALDLGSVPPQGAHGLYEYLEFQDRQAKYVISRQRIYEYLGLEWRLPLWSRDYLDFWQTVPLEYKREQKLYAQMLEHRNWGGVWGPGWTFPRYVSPGWMRWLVRPAAMVLCAPLGRAAWHEFERRYLGYWTDLLAFQTVVPYRQAALDRRGARHLVAWHTEAYLGRKRLTWEGRPV